MNNFSRAESVTGSTVNEIQKEKIRNAILQSIASTPYYDGLEIKSCDAISAINKYSDVEMKSEIIDNETGKRFSESG